MTVLTSTKGQKNLPPLFAPTFAFLSKLKSGRLDIVLPDGRRFRAEGQAPGPVAEIEVHNPDIVKRVVRDGHLGFAEAYLDGWWSTPDLMAVLDILHETSGDVYDQFKPNKLLLVFDRLRHWLNSNSKAQAKKNISYHYDLGNDFYGLWLDDTMTYSSAIFETGQESMEAAQTAKYKSIVDQMGAQPGDHILEIGCGWGGFAEYAAGQRGLKVTCLTISEEQYKFAVERIEKAGLSDMVEFRLQDYRDETGKYDGIASIEMFEAVGQKYWPVYFDTVKNRLKPGRQATLQVITIRESSFERYQKGVDFIQKYIFPGGMLPSPTRLREEVEKAGLSFVKSIEFGDSYSQTLRRWYDDFNDRWDDVAGLGFDDRFRRMWNFYLTSCAASFQGGNCDVTQVTIANPG